MPLRFCGLMNAPIPRRRKRAGTDHEPRQAQIPFSREAVAGRADPRRQESHGQYSARRRKRAGRHGGAVTDRAERHAIRAKDRWRW